MPLALPLPHGFALRDLAVPDLTTGYIGWFNSDYVKRGLNISARSFTLFDHMRHIEQCATQGFLLLTLADAQGQGLNAYVKMRFDPLQRTADLDLAIDRTLPSRDALLRDGVAALSRHVFATRGVAKIKLRINRRNAAARLYADLSPFRLEGILREEVLLPDGRRDDVLLYALFPHSPRQDRP